MYLYHSKYIRGKIFCYGIWYTTLIGRYTLNIFYRHFQTQHFPAVKVVTPIVIRRTILINHLFLAKSN